MGKEPKKLILADDHHLFREGMKELIGYWEEFDVIGEAENGKQAVVLCGRLKPDIVLMDIQMPVMSGVDATKLIMDSFPQVQVVMLTMSVEEEDLFEAIKAGAQGYLLKNIYARHLRESLVGIVNGEVQLSGPVATKILDEFKKLEKKFKELKGIGKIEALTDREIQLLQAVAEGMTNTEIGEKLYLSPQTVKRELSRIMQKLHLNNRVQVATYALRKGYAK